MTTRDMKVDLKRFYHAPPLHPVEADVPTMNFPKIDGEGGPNTRPAYADDMANFSVNDRAQWCGAAMIMQPDFASADTIDAARSNTRRNKKLALDRMRFSPFCEGLAAKVMRWGRFRKKGRPSRGFTISSPRAVP